MMKKDSFICEGVTRDLPSEATGKSKSSKYCEVSWTQLQCSYLPERSYDFLSFFFIGEHLPYNR